MSPTAVPHEALERANRTTLTLKITNKEDLRVLPAMVATFVKKMEANPNIDPEQSLEQFALEQAGGDTRLAYVLGSTLGNHVELFKKLEATNIYLDIKYPVDGPGCNLDATEVNNLKRELEAILGKGRIGDIVPLPVPARPSSPTAVRNLEDRIIGETRDKMPEWT